MNRHVVVNCDAGCSHRLSRFDAKQLQRLPDSARDARLHILKEEDVDIKKAAKPRTIRRQVHHFVH